MKIFLLVPFVYGCHSLGVLFIITYLITYQKYDVDEKLRDEALLREDNKEDVQVNEEHAQVGTNLDLLLGDIRMTQGASVHVDFFIPKGFFEKSK